MEILYSLKVMNPEQGVRIIVPKTIWYELLYSALVDLAWSCVLPAALFALAWLLLTR